MKFITLIFIFFIYSTNAIANDKEDTLKGVILERISQFITYNSEHKEFIICIYNDEKMAESFKKLYTNRKYKKIPIKIINIKSTSEIIGCDILYARNQKPDVFKNILSDKHLYTLLVTDEVELLDEGFMLALYKDGKKINFAINHQAIVDANLKINYRLLKVSSKVVNPLKN